MGCVDMNIYLNSETDFIHNGLGFLTDILNATVTDNLNGDYSLYFEYKTDGHLSEYIQNENIVKCKVADGTKQLFVIKSVVKTFNLVQVNCKHIFYSLLDNFLEDVAPTNLSCLSFLKWILDRTNYDHSFIAHSDISASKSARYVRKNPVDAILGDSENSMVNLFGGELKRDNFDIYFNNRIGYDNGVKLIVGKNITGINITIDSNSVHTKIMPQGFDGLLLPEKYVESSLVNMYPNPKIYKVEFSNIKYDPNDENCYHTLDDAYAALRNEVNELFANGIDKPNINIKVNWIELSKTNEYKNYSNLEKVNIGDTITIDLLGMIYKTRVIKTIYNLLNDRIESFELGTPKANLSTSTNQIIKKIETVNPSSILEEARKYTTEQLTKAMGGYVYKTENELFIMDTNDVNTAIKIWRWNMNGLGYSKNGIDGPYETAMTSDGQIIADFITAGKLSISRIEGLADELSNIKSSLSFNNDNVQFAIAGTGGNNKFYNAIGYFGSSSWAGSVKPFTNTEIQLQTGEKSCWLLQNGIASQTIQVKNGKYTISFLYKKLLELANCKVRINGGEFELTETNYTKFLETFEVTNNTIKFEMESDTNDSCYLCLLMCNEGEIAQPYSNNANETVTDTVKIGDGIEISSTKMNTKQKQDGDGNRIINTTTGEVVTEYTDKGTKTKEFESTGTSKVNGVLFARIGTQSWMTGV